MQQCKYKRKPQPDNIGVLSNQKIATSDKDPEFVFDCFRGVDNQYQTKTIQTIIDLVNGYTKEEDITVKVKGKHSSYHLER